MMARFQCMKEVRRSGVIAILRKLPSPAVIPVIDALVEGGIRVLELTVESRGALANLEKAVTERADQVLIGAGTVLDAATARAAINAGAEFIVTPTVSVEVIETAHRYGKAVFPGAFTPTEILTAYTAGAEAVKVFPAVTLGPDYLKQLKGPLGHIPLVPTGGIDANNAGAYIRAGALAVGVGGSLIDKEAIQRGQFEVIARKARALVDAVEEALSARNS